MIRLTTSDDRTMLLSPKVIAYVVQASQLHAERYNTRAHIHLVDGQRLNVKDAIESITTALEAYQ